jgi:hypothetical protein
MATSDEECITFKDANYFFSIEAEGKPVRAGFLENIPKDAIASNYAHG